MRRYRLFASGRIPWALLLPDPEDQTEDPNNACHDGNKTSQRWLLVESGLAIGVVAHECTPLVLQQNGAQPAAVRPRGVTSITDVRAAAI